jgi:hypothetical protein
VERPEADDTKLAEAKDALTDPVVDTETEPLGDSVTYAETEAEGESDKLHATLALGGL